jgi:hypothetical protein
MFNGFTIGISYLVSSVSGAEVKRRLERGHRMH